MFWYMWFKLYKVIYGVFFDFIWLFLFEYVGGLFVLFVVKVDCE